MSLRCFFGIHDWGPVRLIKEAYSSPLLCGPWLFFGLLASSGAVYGRKCERCGKVKKV
jgi:hypothetical protein